MRRSAANRIDPRAAVACCVCMARAHEAHAQRVGNGSTRERAGARASEPRGQMSFTYQYQKSPESRPAQGTSQLRTDHDTSIDVAAQLSSQRSLDVNAGLPFISREWKGGPSHDPLNIVPPQFDSEFVDDGHFHGFFQDLRLGASYLAYNGPIMFEPYLEYGIPASDYPFFAASAVGRQSADARSRVGVRLSPAVPEVVFLDENGLRDGRFRARLSTRTRCASPQTRCVSSARVDTERFVTSKNGGGVSPPEVPPDRTSELWYRHDQFTRHNYMNVGVGVDWSLGERNVLNFTMLRMVHAEDIFELDEALSVSFSRSF